MVNPFISKAPSPPTSNEPKQREKETMDTSTADPFDDDNDEPSPTFPMHPPKITKEGSLTPDIDLDLDSDDDDPEIIALRARQSEPKPSEPSSLSRRTSTTSNSTHIDEGVTIMSGFEEDSAFDEDIPTSQKIRSNPVAPPPPPATTASLWPEAPLPERSVSD